MRAKGRATLRADGRWATSVNLPSGRRHYLYGATQREVLRKAAQLRKAVEDGESGAESRLTVDEYLTDWLERMKPQLKPVSHTRYSQLLRIHALPALGKTRLGRLTAASLQDLYTDLSATIGVATIRNMHGVLHHALGDARKLRLVRENVAEFASPPRRQQYEGTALTAPQARQLLEAARGDPLEAVWVLALNSGMRQGELLGLRWADVDLERGRLSVRGSLGRDAAGQLAVLETKTASSRRSVGLTKAAIAALERRRETQTTARLLAGKRWRESDLVFTTADGEPIQHGRILEHHYVLLGRAELPRVRFHDLRHTVATLLIESGLPVRAVADLLGHASPLMTLGRYSHATENLGRAATDALDGLFPD